MLPLKSSHNPGYARGLSLIELMVSILLGLVLTAGIVNVYLASKRNFVAEEDMARIQENGRYALNILKRELMLAGFYAGSLSVDVMDHTDASPAVTAGTQLAWALTPTDPVDLVKNYSGSATAVTVHGISLSGLPTANLKQDSDLFAVKRTAGDFTVKSGSYNTSLTAADPNQWYLRVENHGVAKGWINYGTGTFPSTDIVTNPSHKVDFWEVYANVFYIRKYSIVSTDLIPTLCMAKLKRFGLSSDCLVEGVENMQIEFGVDNDGDGVPNRFFNDPTALQLSNAVVARVYLLVRGTNEIAGYTNSKSYNLGQEVVAAKNDAYMRRVFSTTVQMRNATLPEL